MYRVLDDETNKNRVVVNGMPPAIALSDNEIIILNGNIESIAILDDDDSSVGITTRSGHYYQADGKNAVKFLNALPLFFFTDAKNLLTLRGKADV